MEIKKIIISYFQVGCIYGKLLLLFTKLGDTCQIIAEFSENLMLTDMIKNIKHMNVATMVKTMKVNLQKSMFVIIK